MQVYKIGATKLGQASQQLLKDMACLTTRQVSTQTCKSIKQARVLLLALNYGKVMQVVLKTSLCVQSPLTITVLYGDFIALYDDLLFSSPMPNF